MYLTDYMFSQLYPNLMFEQFADNQMQEQPMPNAGMAPPEQPMQPPIQGPVHPEMAQPMQPDQQFGGPPGEEFGDMEDGSSGSVEFENIKRYILYDKLKDVKHRLETSDINHSDPVIKNILEFIDLIILFYNTFTYEDTVKLYDSLVDSISTELKIKLPSRTENLPDDDEFSDDLQTQPNVPTEVPIS